MSKRIICILVWFFSCMAFAQNYTKHTVAKGETIISIAEKYKVTPYDIYKLNPDSQNGIQLNSTLLIPKSTQKTAAAKPAPPPPPVQRPFVKTVKSHTVQAKETLYSISRLYGAEIDDIRLINKGVNLEELKVGQEIKIPVRYKSAPSDTTIHEVKPKETKYGIAAQYHITVEELERQNPEIGSNLPVGYQLKINKKAPEGPEVTIATNDEKPKATYVPVNNNYFEYTVKAGETLYSLTRQFTITADKLTALNPELKDGVKEGMVLRLPAAISYSKEAKNPFADLTKTISKQNRKELVLLLPFNISKMESDTVQTVANRLKKDKFLNMTLDFYSGALMAIDSAKVLGLNIEVKIFDSEETKSTSNAVSIVKTSAQNAAAVIGPFYQDNAEKVAEALEDKNIPVISPLSKEYDKSYKNLYQATPNNDMLKQAMFDFMHAKNGNIIAVVDPKKPAIRNYILENQKGVKLVGTTEKGGFVSDSIRKYFEKDRLNFVVMESENYYPINTTLNTLASAMKDYQVQLVILEPNEMLDNEEIALSRLTKVKMTFPSLTRENDSPEAMRFEKAYKKKNRVLPNQYAIRGFDLTLDTMLRLSQEKPFAETMSTATEQVENKFDYDQKVAGGFINNGIYILYYNTDLTIKEAE